VCNFVDEGGWQWAAFSENFRSELPGVVVDSVMGVGTALLCSGSASALYKRRQCIQQLATKLLLPDFTRAIQELETRTFVEALGAVATLPESVKSLRGRGAAGGGGAGGAGAGAGAGVDDFASAFLEWAMGSDSKASECEEAVSVLGRGLLFNEEDGVRTKHHGHILRLLSKLSGGYDAAAPMPAHFLVSCFYCGTAPLPPVTHWFNLQASCPLPL
jgi:hypothetical protein